MQAVSTLYANIVSGDHWFEVKAIIDGTTYDETHLKSVSTHTEFFERSPEIGAAIAQEVDIVLYDPAAEIPGMAEIELYVRACNATSQSEWLPQGVFYIDTRETSLSTSGIETLTIHGFDAMLRAETDYATTSLNWPALDVDIVEEIASAINVGVDERAQDIMTEAYTFPLPTGYTMREMLSYIASVYLGWFIITESGELRLVSITELPPATRLLIDQQGNRLVFGSDRILV